MHALRFCAATLLAALLSSCADDGGSRTSCEAQVTLTPAVLNLAAGGQGSVQARLSWQQIVLLDLVNQGPAASLVTAPRLALSSSDRRCENRSTAVSWRTLNGSVATVEATTDSTARVIAVAPGTTQVVATAVADARSAGAVPVNVTAAD